MRTLLRTTNAHNACVLRATEGIKLGGMWSTPAIQDVRRPVNLGVSSELLADARKAGVNLSALLRRALIAELQQLRSRQWREESVDAVAAYNEQLMLHGACFQGRWGE
jgi:antitoxin CcdA